MAEQIGFIKQKQVNKKEVEQIKEIKNLENKTEETQEIISKFFKKSLDSLNSERDFEDYEDFLNFIQRNFKDTNNGKLPGIIELYKKQKEENSSIEKQIEKLSPEDKKLIKSIKLQNLPKKEEEEKIDEIFTEIEARKYIL